MASFTETKIVFDFEQPYGLTFNFTDWTSDSPLCTESLTYYISKDKKGKNPHDSFILNTTLVELNYSISLDSSVVGSSEFYVVGINSLGYTTVSPKVTIEVNPAPTEVFTFPIFSEPLELIIHTETGPFEYTLPPLMNERETDTMEFEIKKLDTFVTFHPENRTLVFDQAMIQPKDAEYSIKVTNLTVSSKTYTLKVKYEEPLEAVNPMFFVPIFEELEEEEEIVEDKVDVE